MEEVKVPCRKVLAEKEKKRRKVEVKVAEKAAEKTIGSDRVKKGAEKRRAGEEETSQRKKKIRKDTPVVGLDSEDVSSPVPLNHAKLLEALDDVVHVSKNVSANRLDTLKNQTDEQDPPHYTVNENLDDHTVDIGAGHQHNDEDVGNEGHVDNSGGLSGLRTRPSPARGVKPHPESMENPVQDAAAVKTAASEDFLPLLLKDYDRVVNSEKGLHERVEELEEEKRGLEEVNMKQAGYIKELDEKLKKSEEDTHQLRVDRERFTVECGNWEMLRRHIINEYLPTFVRRLHQSADYKRACGEVFSLAIGNGFIDGVSIGRKEKDVQAILAATPNVDPAFSATFKDQYEKLFDKRYPYVDKVSRAYFLDPSSLQNVMPDETGPTLGQGPRDTPTASYA
ncbi:hypothetical protein Tco_0670895 [Tanacetum coccineum]